MSVDLVEAGPLGVFLAACAKKRLRNRTQSLMRNHVVAGDTDSIDARMQTVQRFGERGCPVEQP